MGDPYPRDLVGYGEHPPAPLWPDGARLAVSFVLNYEEGGESTPLEGDAASEGYLHEVVGAPPTVGRRNLNTESMFEYGSRVGFWRIHRTFVKHGLPLTVYAVAQALERNPKAARAMVDAGWEVASHGQRWIDYAELPEDEERDHVRRAIATIERATGQRPVGWYTGRISENTRRLVTSEGGFLYDSDSYADELPYWAENGGKPVLIIPYTLDANDFKVLLPGGFVTAEDFFAYLRDSFDQLYEEGGRLLSVGLHCRIVGRPGRARGLDRFLEHVGRHDKVWVATRAQIAEHWRRVHPFQASSAREES
jgi:putative urate catabolism protein